MSDKGIRFRPMLVGEVARVAGDPRETIRTRLKQDIFGFDRPKGWKRFSDFETIVIGIHARLKRAIHDDDLAQIGSLLAGKSLMDEWNEDEKGVPYFEMESFDRDRFLIFWRDEEGHWIGDVFDSPIAANEETSRRFNESDTVAPVFTVVNLRTFLRQTLFAILQVQIEAEKRKNGGER